MKIPNYIICSNALIRNPQRKHLCNPSSSFYPTITEKLYLRFRKRVSMRYLLAAMQIIIKKNYGIFSNDWSKLNQLFSNCSSEVGTNVQFLPMKEVTIIQFRLSFIIMFYSHWNHQRDEFNVSWHLLRGWNINYNYYLTLQQIKLYTSMYIFRVLPLYNKYPCICATSACVC